MHAKKGNQRLIEVTTKKSDEVKPRNFQGRTGAVYQLALNYFP